MSHAQGEVIYAGKTVGWYEYNGTADVCCTRIFDSIDLLSEHWRKDVDAECKCGKKPTPVILYTNYGGGYYWLGKACLQCKAIVEGLAPWDEPERDPMNDGHPLTGIRADGDDT